MEERKSMGSALVDVFDAGVVLVKSEINAVVKKVSEIAKAKGVGVVLLLAATGPLLLGLIFLILAVFYGLMRLGLAAWAAALIIALVSFAVMGALAFLGLQKLSAEVDTGMPRRAVDLNSSEFKGAATATEAGGVPATSLRYDVPAAATARATVPATTFYGEAPVATSTVAANTGRVYESDADGRAAMYGDRLNEKLDAQHDHDPAVHHPTVVQGAAGIPVSTTPTYAEDMRREGLDVKGGTNLTKEGR